MDGITLSALSLLPLLRAGRLKGPEYVSLTTRVYRQAVDAAWEAMNFNKRSLQGHPHDAVDIIAAKQAVRLNDETLWDLEQV